MLLLAIFSTVHLPLAAFLKRGYNIKGKALEQCYSNIVSITLYHLPPVLAATVISVKNRIVARMLQPTFGFSKSIM